MSDTIKVLFLAADPFEGNRLKLDREARGITEAIRTGIEGGAFELTAEWGVRVGDLQGALLRHRPRIVHYAGHGHADAGIFLESEQGFSKPVDSGALRELFVILKRDIRVVVLNTCESLATMEAFDDVIDYTIGMNADIADEAAIVFSRAFYGALAFGTTVEEAFHLGVNRLRLEGSSETDIPELRIRDGADPAPLVERVERSRDELSGLVTIHSGSVGNVNVAHGDHPLFINHGGR